MAVAEIHADRDLMHECAVNLPALRAFASAPAGEAGVMEIVGRRFAIYPQPDRSDAEWSAWWADYLEVLAPLPAPALEAGMIRWVSDPKSEFLPKPGQLRQLAQTTPSLAARAYLIAERAVESEPHRDEAPEPILEDGRERVKAMLAEFKTAEAKRLAERPQPKAPFRSQGKPDETGITPELRALIERQREGDRG